MGDSQAINNQPRILFITQEDPFYIRIFFEEFLKNYSDKTHILGVVICPTMAKKSTIELVKQMYSFYGMRDFLRMALRYILVKVKGNTLKSLCNIYNIPIYKEYNINGDVFLDYWGQRNLDVIVSVAAPKTFKKNLLNLPKWGCINIHHSKLPHYRGMMPNFWQMYHSEKNSGITVHKINSKIDEGEIILQQEITIDAGESLDSLIKRSKRRGAHSVIEALGMIREGKVVYLPNHIEKGLYFSFPTRADVLEFRRRGKKIL